MPKNNQQNEALTRERFMKFLFDRCIEIASRKKEDEIWELVEGGFSAVHNKEICICAAVKTTTGKVFRGHRHSDCFHAIRERKLASSGDPKDQGFITSKERYVDRAEGYKLQIAAGIRSAQEDFTHMSKHGYCQEGQLYSEDLY